MTLGLTSTPHLHYAQIAAGHPGAVMVTASHNPPRYHGFKLYGADGGSVSYDTGLAELETLVERLPQSGAAASGRLEQSKDASTYIEFLAVGRRRLPAGARLSRLKVVIDASNGSAGAVFRALAHRLGLHAGVINGTPDGFFPNHSPNPLEPASREQIAAEVRGWAPTSGPSSTATATGSSLSTRPGRAIEGYFISALIGERLLAAEPGGAIVYDLISSRDPPRADRRGRRTPIVSRVGYTFIHRAMVAERALFGAETSGHVYFRTAGGFITESAAYALVVVLNLLAAAGRPLSDTCGRCGERYAQAPETNVEVEDREAAMKRVEARHAAAVTDRLDGISVSYPDYWFNVRPRTPSRSCACASRPAARSSPRRAARSCAP